MFGTRALAATLLILSAVGSASAQVTQSWVDRYDGVGEGIGGTDRGFAVEFDSQGNAIVGGFSREAAGGTFLAIKYAPDGTRTWVATDTTPGGGLGRTMTLDNDDNVIVVGTGGGFYTFGLMKYDSNGNQSWFATYESPPGFVTQLDGVSTDSTGAIYAYGNQYSFGSEAPAIFVLKYAADGTFLWDVVYDPQESWGTGIVAADDGVYVVGSLEVASNDQDLLVLKISSFGIVEWTHTFGRTALFANDGATGVAIDSAGNVVAAGSYSGNGSGGALSTDVAVVRIAPNGTVLSEATYDGPLGLYNIGLALALDPDDNAIVTGRQSDPSDPSGSYDIQTVKLDPAGNALWEQTWGGLATFTDSPYDMAADHLGGVYVTGETWSHGPIREYFTIKYDAAGTLEWEQLYGGATNNPSYGMAIAVDSDGRVAVTGYSGAFGPFGDSDAATVSYTQTLPCLGDLDDSGDVGFSDILDVIGAWGPCGTPCPQDLSGNGQVDFADILALIGVWGPCS